MKKNNDRIGDFGSKLLSSFLNVSISLFSQVLTLQTKTNSGNVENTNKTSVWLASVRFLTLRCPCLVSTDISGTTGIDQLTHRCVMFRRLVFLNFTAETW